MRELRRRSKLGPVVMRRAFSCLSVWLVGVACGSTADDSPTVPSVCTPGTPGCSGPESCPPGEQLCRDGSVVVCSSDGQSRSVIDECGALERCDPVQGCVPDAPASCTPGQRWCVENEILVCSDGGTSSTVLSSCPDERPCENGECRPLCAPGALRCEDGVLWRCDASGAAWAEDVVCGAEQYCDAVTGSCVARSCAPGARSCQNGSAVTCNAMGSAWDGEIVDCAALGQVCEDAGCLPVVCEPGVAACVDGDIQRCRASGAGYDLEQTCAETQFCSESGAPPSCQPQNCRPDSVMCDLETFTSCALDGSGPVAGGTDCAAGELVCSFDGCDTVAVDQIAATAMADGGAGLPVMTGNILEVRTPRRLVEIQQALWVYDDTDTELHWFVYAGSALSGSYSLVFDRVTAPVLGGSYASSGGLDLPLEAGRYYYVGVVLVGDGLVDNWFGTIAAPEPVSFGVLHGQMTVFPAADPPPSSQAVVNLNLEPVQQRLTTTR